MAQGKVLKKGPGMHAPVYVRKDKASLKHFLHTPMAPGKPLAPMRKVRVKLGGYVINPHGRAGKLDRPAFEYVKDGEKK